MADYNRFIKRMAEHIYPEEKKEQDKKNKDKKEKENE